MRYQCWMISNFIRFAIREWKHHKQGTYCSVITATGIVRRWLDSWCLQNGLENTLAWNDSCYPEDIQVHSLLGVGLEPLRRRTVTILMDRHIVNICRTVPSQTTRLLTRMHRFLTGRSSIARSYCLERTSTCKCKPRHHCAGIESHFGEDSLSNERSIRCTRYFHNTILLCIRAYDYARGR